MNKHNKRRKAAGVHLTKVERRELRDTLLEIHGNKCCWCHKPMQLPYKEEIVNLEEMATLEHHFAVEAGEPKNVFLYKLAHKRCNK